MKIGFIGLGIMGKPMSKNLLKAGYQLVVMNRSREAVEEVFAAGATAANSPREVAEQSDIVITMLPNSPQVKEVVPAKDGIIEAARTGVIVIDISSIAPLVSREIAAKRYRNSPDTRKVEGGHKLMTQEGDKKGQIINLFRSGFLGTFIGMLPGGGGSAASVLSYTQAKNFSKKPEKMGRGAPEGVIAPEAANNGPTGGALVPLLSLGIPGDSTSVQCVAGVGNHVIRRIRQELLPKYPNVDDVVVLNHG